MNTHNKSEFVLLSKLVHILEKKSYYLRFAKSLIAANNLDFSNLSDNDLIYEMFNMFIRNDEIPIYHNESAVTVEYIESEAYQKAVDKSNSQEELEFNKEKEYRFILENEVYIKIQDLKKLYANKCIVLPNSLLKEAQKQL